MIQHLTPISNAEPLMEGLSSRPLSLVAEISSHLHQGPCTAANVETPNLVGFARSGLLCELHYDVLIFLLQVVAR